MWRNTMEHLITGDRNWLSIMTLNRYSGVQRRHWLHNDLIWWCEICRCGHFDLCGHSEDGFGWPDSMWVLNCFKDVNMSWSGWFQDRSCACVCICWVYWWGVCELQPLWWWHKLAHGFSASKWSVDRSCGPCMIMVEAHLVDTWGGALMGVFIVGVPAWGATLLFCWMMVGLGSAQMGCMGVTRLSGAMVWDWGSPRVMGACSTLWGTCLHWVQWARWGNAGHLHWVPCHQWSGWQFVHNCGWWLVCSMQPGLGQWVQVWLPHHHLMGWWWAWVVHKWIVRVCWGETHLHWGQGQLTCCCWLPSWAVCVHAALAWWGCWLW